MSTRRYNNTNPLAQRNPVSFSDGINETENTTILARLAPDMMILDLSLNRAVMWNRLMPTVFEIHLRSDPGAACYVTMEDAGGSVMIINDSTGGLILPEIWNDFIKSQVNIAAVFGPPFLSPPWNPEYDREIVKREDDDIYMKEGRRRCGFQLLPIPLSVTPSLSFDFSAGYDSRYPMAEENRIRASVGCNGESSISKVLEKTLSVPLNLPAEPIAGYTGIGTHPTSYYAIPEPVNPCSITPLQWGARCVAYASLISFSERTTSRTTPDFPRAAPPDAELNLPNPRLATPSPNLKSSDPNPGGAVVLHQKVLLLDTINAGEVIKVVKTKGGDLVAIRGDKEAENVTKGRQSNASTVMAPQLQKEEREPEVSKTAKKRAYEEARTEELLWVRSGDRPKHSAKKSKVSLCDDLTVEHKFKIVKFVCEQHIIRIDHFTGPVIRDWKERNIPEADVKQTEEYIEKIAASKYDDAAKRKAAYRLFMEYHNYNHKISASSKPE